jgi:hypothetical protein
MDAKRSLCQATVRRPQLLHQNSAPGTTEIQSDPIDPGVGINGQAEAENSYPSCVVRSVCCLHG